jgi:hypothetical protein
MPRSSRCKAVSTLGAQVEIPRFWLATALGRQRCHVDRHPGKNFDIRMLSEIGGQAIHNIARQNNQAIKRRLRDLLLHTMETNAARCRNRSRQRRIATDKCAGFSCL